MDLRLIICFIRLKSVSCSGPHFHGSFFLSSFLDRSEKFRRNFAMYSMAPRNDFRSFVFSSAFNFSMASTFSSFGLIPFSSISCPSHFVRFMKNSDFLLLAQYPDFSSFFRISNNFFPWSCLFPRVTTIMSSSQAVVKYSSVRSFFS